MFTTESISLFTGIVYKFHFHGAVTMHLKHAEILAIVVHENKNHAGVK